MASLVRRFAKAIATAYNRWSEDGGAFLAGSVAYFAAVAFFPLLLVVMSITGWFLSATRTGQDAETYILDSIGEQLSPVLRSQVETVFSQVRNKASLGGPVGILTLLTVVVALFTQIDGAFDRIWNVKHADVGFWAAVRRVLLLRLRAFLMLAALLLAIVVVFFSGMALAAVEKYMGENMPMSRDSTWTLQLAASFILNSLVFSLIYYLLPNAVVPWWAALRGGLLAAFVWEIGRQALAAYIIGNRYESAYGVVGAFLAIMLWTYYAATVVFFGAEFTQVLSERVKPAPRTVE